MNGEALDNGQRWPSAERAVYRILVVEDEQLMRSIIVQLLRSEGYEVLEANTAAGALAIFEGEKIDLAILDLNLSSGGSGLDLLGRIRDLGRHMDQARRVAAKVAASSFPARIRYRSNTPSARSSASSCCPRSRSALAR